MKDHLELHNIYLGPDNEHRNRNKSNKLSTIGYHSDVSYEHQPPGITILTLLSVPPTGGDTAWASQTVAYQRLSQPIKTLLEGLRAEQRFPKLTEPGVTGSSSAESQSSRSTQSSVFIL